jgi:hypothetical protein
MPQSPVTFDAVEVLSTTIFGMTCRVGQRAVFVRSGVPKPGTTIRVQGDVGRLVVPKWFALQEGLPVP